MHVKLSKQAFELETARAGSRNLTTVAGNAQLYKRQEQPAALTNVQHRRPYIVHTLTHAEWLKIYTFSCCFFRMQMWGTVAVPCSLGEEDWSIWDYEVLSLKIRYALRYL